MHRTSGSILVIAACVIMTSGLAVGAEAVQPSKDDQQKLQVLTPEGYKRLVTRTEYDNHTVSLEQFLELKQKPNAVILDLRDEKQYQAGHIRGAKHLGADVEDKKLAALVPDKDAPVLLYCTNSLMLTRMISMTDVALPQILAQGYKNVYLLEAAARDWKSGEAHDARLKKLDFVEQPPAAPQTITGESKQ